MNLEIQAQAFAFVTADDVNNTTFYRYRMINRGSFNLNQMYFGQWVDNGLGNYQDDYVGCDVVRGIGYAYNGDSIDDGATGYGESLPAIGIDFIGGPLADPNDGIDNDWDGQIDEEEERISMSSFMYYNGDFTVLGPPNNEWDFYHYLQAIWRDSTHVVFNGTNGHDATGGPGPETNYMFFGDSHPDYPDYTRTESTAGNTPADRRFIMSARPFTLPPGGVQTVTEAAVWARDPSGGRLASLEKMRLADDQVQALFDRCFQMLDGPDAPNLAIQELDQALVIYPDNDEASNNFNESYAEVDPTITQYPDSLYRFEGYQIFQLRDPEVTQAELYDPDRARLVAQCDVKNEVTTLVNYEPDAALGVTVARNMTIMAADEGIKKSFQITEDKFATGDPTLVNHKPYYYMAVVYAHNNYKTYNPTDPTALDGQTRLFLPSRLNTSVYSGIPHIESPELVGTVQQSQYGDGPRLTRIEGTGNGGNILDPDEASSHAIAEQFTLDYPTYKNGAVPVKIKVVDPLQVPDGRFRIVFNGATPSSTWYVVHLPGGNSEDTIYSQNSIAVEKEQLLVTESGEFWGLSLSVVDAENPGDRPAEGNGFLNAEILFGDITKA